MSVRTWKLESPQAGEYALVSLPLSMQSLDDASLNLPAGAYTTFRTYSSSKALHLDDHMLRLEQTAQLAGTPQQLNREALRLALRQIIQDASQPGMDWRIRLTLDLEVHPGVIYISLESLKAIPPETYQSGVLAVTCSLQRTLPKAKLTRFIARASSVRQNLPPGVNEAVMYDAKGRLLEGLSSNFFAARGGVLYTAEEGVLMGVTRSLALQAAEHLQIPVLYEPVSLADLPGLEEAFITSASRNILPLRQIDHLMIGSACPGPLTAQLMNTFQSLIDQQLETI